MADRVVLLRGGPADGIVMTGDFGRSIIVLGEQHGRPGEVARYRRTREKKGNGTVYTFREWDRVVVRVPLASRPSKSGESPHAESETGGPLFHA